MNDGTGFAIVVIASSVLAGFIGYLVFRIKNRSDKQMNKVLNSPELLVEELNKHGKIYDIGKDDIKELVTFTLKKDPESGENRVEIERNLITNIKKSKDPTPSRQAKRVSVNANLKAHRGAAKTAKKHPKG